MSVFVIKKTTKHILIENASGTNPPLRRYRETIYHTRNLRSRSGLFHIN